MNWNCVVDLIQKISAIQSIFLNCFLTFLILRKSPKQLGSYKYLMIYISWFEIIYSILDVVISPIMFSYESILVEMVYTNNSIFSPQVLLILNGLYCSCFGASMGMFGLNFIYRYFVSTGSKYLKTFEDARILMWMIIPVVYGCIWGFTSYFMLAPTEAINDKLRNKLMSTFGWEIEDIVYIGLNVGKDQSDTSFYIDMYSVFAIFAAWAIILSSLLVIFYCGIRCYFKISYLMKIKKKQVNNVSKNSKNLQSQLFNALVIQTAIPVILMHFPVSTVFLYTFLGKDLGTLSGITSITIALFPALDPLPAMFIIKNYRTTIFGLFKITKVKQLPTKY